MIFLNGKKIVHRKIWSVVKPETGAKLRKVWFLKLVRLVKLILGTSIRMI